MSGTLFLSLEHLFFSGGGPVDVPRATSTRECAPERSKAGAARSTHEHAGWAVLQRRVGPPGGVGLRFSFFVQVKFVVSGGRALAPITEARAGILPPSLIAAVGPGDYFLAVFPCVIPPLGQLSAYNREGSEVYRTIERDPATGTGDREDDREGQQREKQGTLWFQRGRARSSGAILLLGALACGSVTISARHWLIVITNTMAATAVGARSVVRRQCPYSGRPLD